MKFEIATIIVILCVSGALIIPALFKYLGFSIKQLYRLVFPKDELDEAKEYLEKAKKDVKILEVKKETDKIYQDLINEEVYSYNVKDIIKKEQELDVLLKKVVIVSDEDYKKMTKDHLLNNEEVDELIDNIERKHDKR